MTEKLLSDMRDLAPDDDVIFTVTRALSQAEDAEAVRRVWREHEPVMAEQCEPKTVEILDAARRLRLRELGL